MEEAEAWEKFKLSRPDAGSVAFQSVANGKYVSAEIEYPGGDKGMLRARADHIGSWEKFWLSG